MSKRWKQKISFEFSITENEIKEHIENVNEIYDMMPNALMQVGSAIVDGYANYKSGTGDILYLIILELVRYNGAIIKKSSNYYNSIIPFQIESH